MNLYAIIIGAFVFLAALAGAGYKGYELGGNSVQVRWDRANAEASAQVEADRKAQEQKARKSAVVLQAKIATQDITNRQIADALKRELDKKPFAPECIVPDSLRDVANNALSNGKSATTGSLPSTGKPITTP